MSGLAQLKEPLALRQGLLQLPGRAVLAPLAGVSDIPFRRICQEHGASLTYVEMLSATALCFGNRKTWAMLKRHPSESVLGVQVTGRSAEEVGKAVELLDREGFDTLDINMGCPVKKVVAAGCGSAILQDTERIAATMDAARASTRRPLSAKIRLGFTRNQVNVTEVARLIGQRADLITIHGRTRSESYGTPVDLAGIGLGVNAARAGADVPPAVLSNGDIFAPQDAERHLRETGADGIMVSRGALGNPWIFRALAENPSPHPSPREWLDVVLRHLEYQEEHYGSGPVAALLMRKHLLWYTKGFAGSKRLRERLGLVASLDEARSMVTSFATQLDPSTRRFESGSGDSAETMAPSPQDDPKAEMDRIHDRGVGAEDL